MEKTIITEKKPNWEIALVAKYQNMSDSQKQIAKYFLENKDMVEDGTITELANGTQTSISSIVRFCNTLGYKGLKELRIKASGESGSVAQAQSDTFYHSSDDYTHILQKTFSKGAQALQDSLAMIDKTAFDAAVDCLIQAENVDIYGCGGSAAIAMLARHQFFKVGIRACVCSGDYVPKKEFLDIKGNYVIFIISSSGETQELVTWCKAVKHPLIKIICLTNRPNSRLAKEADIVLSTSVKTLFSRSDNSITRIAQIAVVDSIYACLMIERQRRGMN